MDSSCIEVYCCNSRATIALHRCSNIITLAGFKPFYSPSFMFFLSLTLTNNSSSGSRPPPFDVRLVIVQAVYLNLSSVQNRASLRLLSYIFPLHPSSPSSATTVLQ